MTPCEINMLIAAITNHLYTTLSKDQFYCLTVFINELSKSMFATILFKDVCNKFEKTTTTVTSSTASTAPTSRDRVVANRRTNTTTTANNRESNTT